MKKTILLFIFLFSLIGYSQSVQFKVSGTIVAQEDQTPLESATVFLQKQKDSSLVTYTITDKNGKFSLQEKLFDTNVELFISYVGFGNYSKKINAQETPELELGNIGLAESANQLDEVIVRAVAPITIKKDTLEFNVKSFKTKKDATVEDLLKELPGVEVDEEGKIKVNGKEVSKILVNGKPFFGDDPTITTRNLTKDIIEKVQITDTKSKSEAFTGEEGDQENKTINLTIKEENNKGTFGRLAAGAGSDKRFEYAGIVNRFDNDRRISV
ncbi:MAG: carboxypeptidase-like regulatory domain-containing protein, partial [Flavobacteriaceae bacterium]|nr:carboxypeptidase-like regulatory domain-containing protein [Flavobacteriaceae bacterium]